MALKSKYEALDGTYVFDCDQHPQFCAGGGLLPCLVTHGLLVDGATNKFLTSSEHLVAMGEVVEKEEFKFETELRCFINEGLQSLTPTARKRIAGNSVHTSVQSTVFFYIMMNLSKKPALSGTAIHGESSSSSTPPVWAKVEHAQSLPLWLFSSMICAVWILQLQSCFVNVDHNRAPLIKWQKPCRYQKAAFFGACANNKTGGISDDKRRCYTRIPASADKSEGVAYIVIIVIIVIVIIIIHIIITIIIIIIVGWHVG